MLFEDNCGMQKADFNQEGRWWDERTTFKGTFQRSILESIEKIMGTKDISFLQVIWESRTYPPGRASMNKNENPG